MLLCHPLDPCHGGPGLVSRLQKERARFKIATTGPKRARTLGRPGAGTTRNPIRAGTALARHRTLSETARNRTGTEMTDETTEPFSAPIPVAELERRRIARFRHEPDSAARAAIAGAIGAERIRKLRFEGTIAPEGRRGWRLEADLGATVVQACVVTLAPVTTRLDQRVVRRYLPVDAPQPVEAEIPQDDTLEPLGAVIDPGAVMVEALALALPLYPRAEGVDGGVDGGTDDMPVTLPGATPAGDGPPEATERPFSGLSGLRDALARKSGGDTDRD